MDPKTSRLRQIFATMNVPAEQGCNLWVANGHHLDYWVAMGIIEALTPEHLRYHGVNERMIESIVELLEKAQGDGNTN